MYGKGVVDLDLPDVTAEHGLWSLWDFEISTRSPGRYRIGQVDLKYDDLNTGRPERLTADLIYEFMSDPADVPGVASHVDFDAEVEVAEAVRSIDKTLLAVRRQNIEPAIVLQELEKAKAIFAKHGRQGAVDAASAAASEVEAGGAVAKILMSTVFNLDQGKAQ